MGKATPAREKMAGSHAGVRRQLAEEKTAAAVKRDQISSVPPAARRLIVLGRRAPHEIPGNSAWFDAFWPVFETRWPDLAVQGGSEL